MRNTIISCICIGGLALAVLGMSAEITKKTDESSDRVASLEGRNIELEQELNSLTDAYRADIASLTDALNATKAEIKATSSDAQEDEEEEVEEDDEEDSDDLVEFVVNPTTEATTETTTEIQTEDDYEPMVFDAVKDIGDNTENDGEITDPNVYYVEDTKTYVGNYQLTAYIATGNPCADGAYPQTGYTVACNDPNLWHKWIYIEGYGTYYVHDTGGMPSNYIIDIFMGSYSEAIQFGRRSADVYIVN